MRQTPSTASISRRTFVRLAGLAVGAGAASGSNDASNILKPALSRGETQCIGATTMD